MILHTIKMKDWRCFYGSSEIQFSTDSEKNVTLIHAENGVGKTTLLNALLWCFYGTTTRRFEQPERIINDQASFEGKTFASIEVYFEHNDNDYVAKRHFDSTNPSTKKVLKVAKLEGGHEVPHETADMFINSVIPREMAGHFLFDGEHAEAISGEENRVSVGGAIRDILGTTLIEDAITDLESAEKHYRAKASSAGRSHSDLSALRSSEKSKEEQMDKANKEIEIADKSYETLQKQIDDIENQLRGSKAVKAIQRRRDDLEAMKGKLIGREREALNDSVKWLGESGRVVVSKKFETTTFDCLEEESTKGKIPAPYDEDFVKSIIQATECICGRPLEPESKEAKAVLGLLKTASSKILQDRVIMVRARLQVLRRDRKQAPDQLQNANRRLAELRQEKEVVEAKLAECSKEIQSTKISDIEAKEKKLQECKNEQRSLNQSIGAVKQNIRITAVEIEQIRREIRELASKDEGARKYVDCENLAREIKEKLKRQLKSDEKSARGVIRKIISDIIDATTRKNLKVRLGEDYVVDLMNSDNQPMPKSEGENQLLGLAFTAALAQFAKLRAQASGLILLPGTEAPLVLDAPFGKLDSVYKPATAEFLPTMSKQLVFMLNKEHCSDNVMSAIGPRIGKEYVLVRHNKGEQGAKPSEIIELPDGDIEITKYESQFDGTEVIGV
jgi:DNA sulfur modification protein DndD